MLEHIADFTAWPILTGKRKQYDKEGEEMKYGRMEKI